MRQEFQLVGGQHPQIAALVARGQHLPDDYDWGKYSTLSFVDKRGPICALLYHCFTTDSVYMHIWARPGALWCKPSILYHIFAYPFKEMGVVRVTAPVRADNEKCIKVVEALGYQQEGRIRFGGKRPDILVYGMLADECRWIKN